MASISQRWLIPTHLEQEHVGDYPVGSIPEPFFHRYVEHDGVTPSDVTFSTFEARGLGPSTGIGTGVLAESAVTGPGWVSYTPAATEFNAPGFHSLQFWVTKGGLVRGSKVFTFRIYQGPETP